MNSSSTIRLLTLLLAVSVCLAHVADSPEPVTVEANYRRIASEAPEGS